MKKILTAALAAIACTMPALAVVSINPDDIRVSDLEVARNGNGLKRRNHYHPGNHRRDRIGGTRTHNRGRP